MAHLTARERDILTEVANIGAGHATRPLAQFTGERITAHVPMLNLVSVEAVPGIMGASEEAVTIVAVRIKGEIAGTILLLVTPANADRLLAHIPPGQKMSALEEIANILAGSALGALGKFLGLTLLQSVPGSATDMLQALVGEITSELAAHANDVLVLGIDFEAAESHAAGRLYFLFTPTSTQALLRAGHAKIGEQPGGPAA
jgi:chemotaxis protein CheC